MGKLQERPERAVPRARLLTDQGDVRSKQPVVTHDGPFLSSGCLASAPPRTSFVHGVQRKRSPPPQAASPSRPAPARCRKLERARCRLDIWAADTSGPHRSSSNRLSRAAWRRRPFHQTNKKISPYFNPTCCCCFTTRRREVAQPAYEARCSNSIGAPAAERPTARAVEQAQLPQYRP